MMTIRPHGLKSGLWKRLVLFASSCFLLPLLVPSFGILRYGVLYMIFVSTVLWGYSAPHSLSESFKRSRGATLLVSLLLILIFFLHWHKWFIHQVVGSSSWLSYMLTGIAALVFLAGSFPFLSALIYRILRSSDRSDASQSSVLQSNMSRHDIFVSLLMAVVVITLCCCFSPLYATNTWCSPACYHTVGKSLWSGLLPYRDLYEHKGPLVYALYSLATLISYKSFFGMYLFSLPFAFSFFYFSRKALHVLTNRSIDPWFIIVGIGIYCVFCYFCGGSVEELLLPFLAYALYVAAQRFCGDVGGDTPCQPGSEATRHIPTNRQSFFLGLGIAVVLWTKFNILAFYFGYGLFFIGYSILNRQVRDFFRALLPAFLGFLSVTLPIILFYAFNGALGDLFQVYFHDNLFLYMDAGDIMVAEQVKGPIGQFCVIAGMNMRDNSMFFIAILLAALWLVHEHRPLGWLFVLTFSFTALFIFIKPDYYKYYCFILAAFVPYCVLPLSALSWPAEKVKMLYVKRVVVLLTVAIVVAGSDNLWKMKLKKDDYNQFRFARIIMKEPSPTLLNYYCQDQGVFAVTGIVPTNRFYCDFNNSLSDVHKEQDSIVSMRGVQFVVAMMRFKFEGYDIVDQAICPVTGVMFYLYKRKEKRELNNN